MDPARWQRVAAIFDQAMDVAPDMRTPLLDRLCADDTQLRREAEDLLNANAAAAVFDRGVNSACGVAAAEWADSDESEGALHDRVGPWRLLRELGRGGMGVVWLAERADEFEQRAALKLIKRGMDSEAVIARFLRERQILAQLEHPHIARLFDGGMTADGRPYFAMEYIDGQPLVLWCVQQRIKLEDRIKVFMDICAAVQFAHGRLVVHRDLKPSNVLVTADGRAKLMDFGIAKLLAADDGNAGTGTGFGHDRPLTPAYAAPEQLRGDLVTVATDIYSLGVLLYELITERRPFDFSDASTPENVARTLQTSSPTAPSRLGDAKSPFSSRRLRGDLDNIVLKALQYQPDRRYRTTDALADDLRRHLAGLPIAARRDSALHRVRKFVARHRIGVLSSALIAVTLVASTAFALLQARDKGREAAASAEVTQFLADLFSGADPALSRGGTVTAQQLLDQGSARLQTELRAEPVVRARLLHTVATTYSALGLYDRAQPLAQEALTLRREYTKGDGAELAQSAAELGRILRLKGDYAQAEPLLREALRMRQASLSPDNPMVAASLGDLGDLLHDRGEFQKADSEYAHALSLAERSAGADSIETARRLDDRAVNLQDMGKAEDAIASFRRALAIREHKLGANHLDVATSFYHLGKALDDAGDDVSAEPNMIRALTIRRSVLGESHPQTATAELALADIQDGLGRTDDAERHAQAALSVFRQTLGEQHPKVAEALNSLAVLRVNRRDFSGALPLLRDVLARDEAALGNAHPDVLAIRSNLAFTLLHTGGFAEAERLQREVLAATQADNGQEAQVHNRLSLARVLIEEGRFEEAIAMTKEAVAVQQRIGGTRSFEYAVALRWLGLAEAQADDAQSAETDFRAALAIEEELHPLGDNLVVRAQLALADFLMSRRRHDEALALLQKAIEQLQKTPDADPIWRAETELLLGRCLTVGGKSVSGRAMEAQARNALEAIPAVTVDLYPSARKIMHPRSQD
jgi:serine/threonine protein kinase